MTNRRADKEFGQGEGYSWDRLQHLPRIIALVAIGVICYWIYPPSVIVLLFMTLWVLMR